MTASNRSALLAKIHKVLKKHYKPVEPPGERTLLEHLLYACCLENARPEAADEAFAKLQQSYFDWNEVRVTTVNELAELLGNLPHPVKSAQQFKRALQSVFEAHFAFDIEYLAKQNLGKSEKDLERYTLGNPFLISYVVQHGLGGHSIPVCQGTVEALMALQVVTPAEALKMQVPGLERAIPKNKGVEFASLLHQMGADYAVSPPFSTKFKAVLMEIDPDVKDRLPKKPHKPEDFVVWPLAGSRPAAETRPPENRPPEGRPGEARPSAPAGKEHPGKEHHGKEPHPKEAHAKDSHPKSPAKDAGKEADKTKSSAKHDSSSSARDEKRDDKKGGAKKLVKKKPR
ncbi:MAG: hypothetical protein U0939_26730 [Pirellulales bacterium]